MQKLHAPKLILKKNIYRETWVQLFLIKLSNKDKCTWFSDYYFMSSQIVGLGYDVAKDDKMSQN